MFTINKKQTSIITALAVVSLVMLVGPIAFGSQSHTAFAHFGFHNHGFGFHNHGFGFHNHGGGFGGCCGGCCDTWVCGWCGGNTWWTGCGSC